MKEILESIAPLAQEQGQEVYLVGGFVRDILLGRESHDLDLAVDGGGLALTRRIADRTGGSFVVLDSERDTGRVVLRREDAPELLIDVAVFRGRNIEADLRLRDFTINAMAMRLTDYLAGHVQVIDPLGGRRDLEARSLRATSESVFRDDPARLLRAIRLARQMEYRIAGGTITLIRRDASAISSISPERIRDELVQILAVTGTAQAIEQMEGFGLLEPVLPEVAQLRGVEQSPPHTLDVFAHTLQAIHELEEVVAGLGIGPATGDRKPLPEPFHVFREELAAQLTADLVGGRRRYVIVKLGALLHDVGKALTQTLSDDGRIRFLGHAGLGASLAARIMRRLAFGNREEALVQTFVWNHMRPLLLSRDAKLTRRAIYRFFRDTGDIGLDILLFALADHRATSPDQVDAQEQERFLPTVATMVRAYFENYSTVIAPPRLLDGHDLIATFELKPGPRIGELLEAVREGQVEGNITTRQEALDFVALELQHGHTNGLSD